MRKAWLTAMSERSTRLCVPRHSESARPQLERRLRRRRLAASSRSKPKQNEPRLFVGYQNVYMTLTGDLEKPGWEALLDDRSFCEYLSKTTVLLAPHHGREAGVCREAFELMSPRLCIISDGPFSDTSSKVYSGLATGAKVSQRGSITTRRALSTRKDGTIEISIRPSGWTVKIE